MEADGSIDMTALVAVPDEGDSAERPKLTCAEAGRLGAEHGHKGGAYGFLGGRPSRKQASNAKRAEWKPCEKLELCRARMC